MSKKKSLIAFAVCFLMLAGVFFVLSNVRAYDSQNVHPFLTKQIAELYNKVYEPNLTKSQKQQIIQGSSDEDIAPRWINHFYDPITGKEWLGKRMGSLSEEQVRQISKIVLGKDPVSALNWAHNQNLQAADYRLYQGNRTFEAAVLFYLEGDKDNAYYNLGHILHLIEDMTVPAHTRQDSHFDMPVPKEFEQIIGITFDKGEPYENWAKNYTSQNQDLNLVDSLKNNYQPICYSLDDCLTILAQYSNNNFFSQDSIFDKEYNLPKNSYVLDEEDEGKNYIISTYYSKDNYPLAKAKINKNSKQVVKISLDYPDIHQAYWDKLASKAILAGVEVIKYFHEQVEKAENEEIVLKKPEKPNFFALLRGISPWGEMAKIGRFAEGVKQEFYAKLDDAWKELNLSINDLFSRVASFNPFLAFTPPTFSIEETIFSEEIELPPDPFAEEDPNDKTDEILTGIVEYMTGVGGPILDFDFQNQQNVEDALDDIIEKFDILKQQALEFIENYNSNSNDSEENSENDEQQDEQNTEDENTEDENNDDETQQQNNPPNTTTGGGGGSSPIYPKILISEVQIAGLTDEKEEFVELYNPNTIEIDLTNWYLHRKTETGSSYSTFASNTLFSGKKIGAMGYFLIVRQGASFVGLGDIITDSSLGNNGSSSTLALKNPNREISDKLGFGSAQEYETSPAQKPEKGQSIGRKWDTTNNIEQDTDNNLIDFEAQNPTAKQKNSAYVAPVNPPLSPIPPPIPTDTTAPDVIFSLDVIQTSLTFTINFDITDPITTVSPSGIDSYVFRWQEEGGNWQEDSSVKVSGGPTSTNLIRDFTGRQDETTYYFQVKAKDLDGNESDWQSETPAETKISIPKKVLINEIQIDSIVGTGGTDDDWVELYNPNDIAVSLADWSIQKHSQSDPCPTDANFSSFYKKNFSTDAVISAKGFFLIVDTGAQESLKTIADMTAAWSLSENNTVYLAKNQEKIESGDDPDIVDKVGFGIACFSETSPTLNPPEAGSIERKKLGVDTDDNSQDFRISAEPTPKAGSPKSYIYDGTGDVSGGSPPNYLNCRSNSNNVSYYNLKIKWGSNSPNLDFYDVQYKVNDGSWQDWALQTTDTEKIYMAYYSMFTDYVYYFRVRAQDTEGNQGDWAEVTVDVTNPVIINEVALFGTNVVRSDQWIELYNRSDESVDLTGWRIVSGASGSISLDKPLQGIIPSKGYLLLEFGPNEEDGDKSISDIIADQVLIAYVSHYVHLENPNKRKIDQFYTPSQGGYSWRESDFKKDENYHSMERISPYAFGNHHKNWLINNGITINGADRDGGLIYGTPGQPNSNDQIYTPLSTDFTEDTILPLSRSPYLLHSISLSVHKNKVLTIEPGVVMKFYDSYGWAGLKIEGTLNAVGGQGLPIVFTALSDDEYGGDTNQDSDGTQAEPGSWAGLYFSETATNLSELDYIVLRYGGNLIASSYGAGIKANQVAISLSNSIIEKNANNGLWLVNSSSIIDSSHFTAQILEGGKGIYIQGGNPEIKNLHIWDNYYGLYVERWLDLDNALFWINFLLNNNSVVGNTKADIWDVDNP